METNNKMVILQGIPGSGKSTYAEKLLATVKSGIIASADKYFTSATGKYDFNPSKLGEAHEDCFGDVTYHGMMFTEYPGIYKDAMIIVDNTNLTKWEYWPYIMLARYWDMEIEFHRMGCSFETALSRQTHGVPKNTLHRMYTTIKQLNTKDVHGMKLVLVNTD